MKGTQTRKVDRHKYAAYLRKADSFFHCMQSAESGEDWNAACLNAIHCTISANDAITTCLLGERSAGQKHEDAAALLERTGLPDAREKVRQFLAIVQQKTLIEYEPEEPSEAEARLIIKQAHRFYQWAKQLLPKQP